MISLGVGSSSSSLSASNSTSVDGGVDTYGMGSTPLHTCSIDPCVGVQVTLHLRSNENYALGPMS